MEGHWRIEKMAEFDTDWVVSAYMEEDAGIKATGGQYGGRIRRESIGWDTVLASIGKMRIAQGLNSKVRYRIVDIDSDLAIPVEMLLGNIR